MSRRWVAVLVTMGLAVAGCGVNRAGLRSQRDDQLVAATPTTTPTTTGPTIDAGNSGNTGAVGAPGDCRPAPDLMSCVEAAPAGARIWRPRVDWGGEGIESFDHFMSHIYGTLGSADQTEERNRYQTRRLTTVAHRGWTAPTGAEADVVVLYFADSVGAESSYLALTDGSSRRMGSRYNDRFSDSSYRDQGFVEIGLDSMGNQRARLYGYSGRLVTMIFFFFPARVDKAVALDWGSGELDLINHAR